MAQPTLLNDDLLHNLVGVGQVDIVVGVPTLNNAETIVGALRAADEGLAVHFPRDRTVIISADGGSSDGTPAIVTELSSGGANGKATARGLRTRHQISASYHGVPGKAGAVRLIFAAADLLEAKAVAVLDPDVTSLAPAWIASLAGPVRKQSLDFVAPLYGRHPLEGPLITQLIRPLMRATYGRGVEEPLVGEFGCSGRFATHCLAQEIWDSSPIRDGIELSLTGTALAGDFQACQTFVGSRTVTSGHGARSSLRDVFPPVVGSLFASLDKHADFWLGQNGSEPLPVLGPEGPATADAPPLDPAKLGESFCQDVRDIRPVLELIVAADTFAQLWTIVESGSVRAGQCPDDLWSAIVYDFLSAYHVGVMDRTHIVRALMPLYLGRVASFLMQHATSEPHDVGRDLEQAAQQFERSKPYLIERWNRTT